MPEKSTRHESEHDFVEAITVQFVMWCDENGYSVEQGEELSLRLGGEIENAAVDRMKYAESKDA